MDIENRDGKTNSLQISHMGEITSGSGTFRAPANVPFLIKNETDSTLQVTIRLAGNNEFISTAFFSGWNVELVEEVKDAPMGLKYGY